MSLQTWKQNGRIRAIPISPPDIRSAIRAADDDLAQAEAPGLTPSWRLAIAYESARKLAAAALAATGYRVGSGAGHHYYTVQSLRYTAGLEPRTVRLFDAFREKRNDAAYGSLAPPSEREAAEMIGLARTIRAGVLDWLRREHPQVLAKDSEEQ